LDLLHLILQHAEINAVLAPHGCGAIISITSDFMSYNARRLGDVADGARNDLSYHKGSKDTEGFLFPQQPPFRQTACYVK